MNRREFIKIGAAAAIGAGVASAIEIPILQNNVNNEKSNASQLQNQVTQGQQVFLTLNAKEQAAVEALAEAIIPTDSTGPGAKEAGVVYFIDHMLAGNYGKGGNMFLQGPFIMPQTGPLTVMGAVYPSTTKIRHNIYKRHNSAKITSRNRLPVCLQSKRILASRNSIS